MLNKRDLKLKIKFIRELKLLYVKTIELTQLYKKNKEMIETLTHPLNERFMRFKSK